MDGRSEVLGSAGNEDVCTPFNEKLCRCERHAGRRSGDDCRFSFELPYNVLLSYFVGFLDSRPRLPQVDVSALCQK